MEEKIKKILDGLLGKILRIIFLPAILFVAWSEREWQTIRRQRLIKKLDAADPSTLALYGKIDIACPENCHIGYHVAIHDADWNASGQITIGNYVYFGPRVNILTISHNIEGNKIPYDPTYVYKPVVIEDFVWVGTDVVIAPGTHIEEGAVIAMGSTISGRIPKGAIVGNQKFRILKYRDMEKYESLKAEKKFHA